MILTGAEIAKRVKTKEIVIDPFFKSNINPNSYNFSLSHRLMVYEDDLIDTAKEAATREIIIPTEGLVLEPRRLYLASTNEVLGSKKYVPTYAARSSIARLGMFINLSAPLGDIGFIGVWTLQLYCLQPTKIYAGMHIGQMMFWSVSGEVDLYDGKYQSASGIVKSLMYKNFEGATALLDTPRAERSVVSLNDADA